MVRSKTLLAVTVALLTHGCLSPHDLYNKRIDNYCQTVGNSLTCFKKECNNNLKSFACLVKVTESSAEEHITCTSDWCRVFERGQLRLYIHSVYTEK